MTEIPAVYHPKWKGKLVYDDLELFCVGPRINTSLNNFNPIIVLGGAVLFIDEGYERVAEVVRREREIFNALENQRVVCITGVLDDLVLRVSKRVGMEIHEWEQPRADIIIKRSEFSPFLKRFGAVDLFFLGDFDDIICETEDEEVVGFAKKIGRGVLIFLPCHIMLGQYTQPPFLKEFLATLLGSLRTYGPKIQYKPPSWISNYKFPKESTIMSKVQELRREIDKREKSLEAYLRLKEILWFKDDELVTVVMNFFSELGIETQRDEIYEEDFWIIEHNKETVIVEVKGLDKNLKRQHISQLDEHRAAREKPDDFPALLIVNSFNRARSLKEKDVDISANEIKKAVRTNVLILRTLDLCNAFYLMERKKLDPKALLNIIKKEKGWLNTTPSGLEIKK